MKTKKLKKIIEKAISDAMPMAFEKFREAQSIKEVSSAYDFSYTEYDAENSKKFSLMLNNMLPYVENLNIRVTNDSIFISANDFTEIKKVKNPNSYNDSNCLEIEINKIGFSINIGYKKRTSCYDENILNTFLPLFKEKMISISKSNFDSLYNDIMLQSGMIRDANLKGLIEDICEDQKLDPIN
jgi:hypothetical protein